MPHYRAYPLDGGGHFIGATDFEATDDRDAVQVVEALPQGSYEVWCGGRFIGRVDCDDGATKLAPPSDHSVTG